MVIPAEYLVGNILISEIYPHNWVDFPTIRKIAVKVQKAMNDNNIDRIVLVHSDNISKVIDNFPEYFTYTEYTDKNNISIPTIRVKLGITKFDLKERFYAYLPPNVLHTMKNAIDKYLTYIL